MLIYEGTTFFKVQNFWKDFYKPLSEFLYSDFMKNTVFVSAVLMLAFLHSSAQKKYVFTQPKMGSPFTITIDTQDSLQAANLAALAFGLADSLNFILSDYIYSSEINRLSAQSGTGVYVPVSKPLFQIIQQAQTASKLSNGAFDISMGPVVKLWREARKTGVFPAADSLKFARQKTGYQYIHLDVIHQSIWLEKKGMQLDVGGLGKGFVAQAALNVIMQNGCRKAMVNAGGNIVTGDKPDGQTGWLVGINAPEEKEDILPRLLSLHNMAVSTSGDLYQQVEIDGKTYSHIVKPKTGIGLTHNTNVTAIAPDGTTADWLSTACSVLTAKRAMRLIKKINKAALLITEKKGANIRKRSTKLFKNYYF